MSGLSLKMRFAKSNRFSGLNIAVLGAVASAMSFYACSAGPAINAFVGPPVCGDGIRSGNEECDGDDLGGVTCEMIGAGSGTLLCNPISCRFVFFQCSGSIGGGGTVADGGGVSGGGGTGDATVTDPCTPNAEETEACGGCGHRSRICQPNGVWSEWSICNDACGNPFCGSEAQLPSWDNSIERTVQSLCGSPGCHAEANSYDSFVSWYNIRNSVSAGSFETYLSPTHYNPRTPVSEYVTLKCWLALGMP